MVIAIAIAIVAGDGIAMGLRLCRSSFGGGRGLSPWHIIRTGPLPETPDRAVQTSRCLGGRPSHGMVIMIAMDVVIAIVSVIVICCNLQSNPPKTLDRAQRPEQPSQRPEVPFDRV